MCKIVKFEHLCYIFKTFNKFKVETFRIENVMHITNNRRQDHFTLEVVHSKYCLPLKSDFVVFSWFSTFFFNIVEDRDIPSCQNIRKNKLIVTSKVKLLFILV